MHRLSTIALVLSAISLVQADYIVVGVGGQRLTGAHAMLPRVLHAKKGDIVSFTFQPDADGLTGNHSIVQTSAEKPCTPLKGGFASAQIITPGTSFNIVIEDDTTPIYYACGSTTLDRTDDHCQQGEVGVINPSPEEIDTTDEFDAASLVADAEAAPHDGAMDSVPAGGSELGSGVGARVLGTFSPQEVYSLPPNIYPTPSSTSDDGYINPLVPTVEPTPVPASSDKLSTAAIAGIAVGSVALLALLIAVGVRTVLVKRRKAKTEQFGRNIEAYSAKAETRQVQPSVEV